MSNFANTLKDVLARSARLAGATAGRVAKATKFKTNELTELGKRRELISELGAKTYELSQNGLVLPEEAAALVQQIAALDNELALLRADRATEKEAYAQQRAEEKAARAAARAAALNKETVPVETYTFEPEMPVAEIPAEEEAPAAPVAPTLEVAEEPAPSRESGDVPTLNV